MADNIDDIAGQLEKLEKEIADVEFQSDLVDLILFFAITYLALSILWELSFLLNPIQNERFLIGFESTLKSQLFFQWQQIKLIPYLLLPIVLIVSLIARIVLNSTIKDLFKNIKKAEDELLKIEEELIDIKSVTLLESLVVIKKIIATLKTAFDLKDKAFSPADLLRPSLAQAVKFNIIFFMIAMLVTVFISNSLFLFQSNYEFFVFDGIYLWWLLIKPYLGGAVLIGTYKLSADTLIVPIGFTTGLVISLTMVFFLRCSAFC